MNRNRWHKSVAGTLSVASKKIITATLKTCPTNGLTPAFLSLESVARGSPLLLRRLEPCLEDDVVGEQRRRLPRLFLPPDPLDEILEALALALLAMYRLDLECLLILILLTLARLLSIARSLIVAAVNLIVVCIVCLLVARVDGCSRALLRLRRRLRRCIRIARLVALLAISLNSAVPTHIRGQEDTHISRSHPETP